MKIAILGTRGIPNRYGGFEQFADILSQGLVQKGHEVTVYCSNNQKYNESTYNGVKLVFKYDPKKTFGSASQFIYDFFCMIHARQQKYDIIYLLGYTSSSIWQRILKNKSIIITNMDGLEWKRSKYLPKVQQFLKYAEKLAVKHSDHLVADSIGIQSYLKSKYGVDSTYQPYGSFVFKNASNSCLDQYNLSEYNYDMLIARFEPENNIEMILEAFSKSTTTRTFILIGNYKNTLFCVNMQEKFSKDDRIQFLGAIYDQTILDNLRYYSNLYFHGHSVGGTNPSLLEAMGSSCLICYHNNEFNSTIIGNDGCPFNTAKELTQIIDNTIKSNHTVLLDKNREKINNIFSWDIIISNYEVYFKKLLLKNV